MHNLIAVLILFVSFQTEAQANFQAKKAQPKSVNSQAAQPAAEVTRFPAQASEDGDEDEDDGSGPAEPQLEEGRVKPPPPPVTSDSTPIPAPTDGYQEPQAGPSQKIYDWRNYDGSRQIDHPLAEKGLIRITKDQVYIYKTEETKQRRAASFHVGMLTPENLENPEQAGLAGSTFEENYDSATGPMLMAEYEWQLWQTPIGKLGIRVGSGLFVAQGHGHFVKNNTELEPRENFTFLAFPNSLGAIYRAQLWHKQLFVPYAEGGGIAWTFTELRDDDTGFPKAGAALGAYAAAGVGMNLTYFDAFSRIQLDREYGINAVYLTAEFRTILALSEKYDFSSDVINGGFLMEF